MNAILVVFGVVLAMEVFGMVVLYNATVNLDHGIATAKAQLDATGAANTNLNNTIIGLLGSDDAAALAAKDGLVQEQKPQYVRANQQWPIASQ